MATECPRNRSNPTAAGRRGPGLLEVMGSPRAQFSVLSAVSKHKEPLVRLPRSSKQDRTARIPAVIALPVGLTQES